MPVTYPVVFPISRVENAITVRNRDIAVTTTAMSEVPVHDRSEENRVSPSAGAASNRNISVRRSVVVAYHRHRIHAPACRPLGYCRGREAPVKSPGIAAASPSATLSVYLITLSRDHPHRYDVQTDVINARTTFYEITTSLDYALIDITDTSNIKKITLIIIK
ncbi:hypothetical protein QE152_g24513 [Popillia japonica]|uniref:Uncharacterized protein n=1 Tax=Popillia japonica TaxID=7064 RepID=A0AAW1KEV7_POPJA